MKILQINTVCGFGSTGSICVQLGEYLTGRGDESYIAYGQRKTDYPGSYKIGGRFENHWHNLNSRIWGNQGYYSSRGTRRLIRYIDSLAPDIIHLHNLHGNYLNLAVLFEYLSAAGIPVAWTLHDCWAFTGKCAHYTSAGCYKWQSGCADCPQWKDYPPALFFDRTARLYRDKKSWFTSLPNMHIITVSKWLEGEASQSYLSRYPISTVYNWVDRRLFFPRSGVLSKRYGIQEDKFIVLGVSAQWSESTSRFQDAVRLARSLPGDMQLVLVGHLEPQSHLPSSIIHIPYVAGADQLAELYSAAGAYVHFSVEDTFGKVIAEAMACGTPVVVFDSTACSELVGPACGRVVAPHCTDEQVKALCQIKATGKTAYSTAAIEHVKKQFDYGQNAARYVQIYKKLLS